MLQGGMRIEDQDLGTIELVCRSRHYTSPEGEVWLVKNIYTGIKSYLILVV